VFLPAHRGHDLLQRCTAFALEHRNNLAGFASFPWRTSLFRGRGDGRLLCPGSLLSRGSRFRRDVGRL
jgi:hypothetical protein